MSTEESLTFANFRPGVDSVYDIGGGVIREMADAFGHILGDGPKVDTLGQLITAVGPLKTLQDNIGHVQEVLGTENDASNMVRNWVTRTGLLTPVERSFMTAEVPTDVPELVVITGGVRNWMVRRADVARGLEPIGRILLVGGNRVMSAAEGPDVAPGMTEADYLERVVAPTFENATVASVESREASGVMAAAAQAITASGIRNVTVASNAGAWVQNAGQLRRALRGPAFAYGPGYDADGTELFVVSDGFPLGTGDEPTATHQNPLTALGIIARNAQELTRHQ